MGLISSYKHLPNMKPQDTPTYMQEKDLLHLQLSLALLLTTTNDIDDIIHSCLEIAMIAADMDSGVIILFNSTGKKIAHCAHRGLSDAFLQNVIHYNSHCQTDNASDASIGRQTLQYISKDFDRQFRGVFASPIFCNDMKLGWMSLASNKIESIPLPVRVHLKTIAATVGTALSCIGWRQELLTSREQIDSFFENASGFAVYRLIIDETSAYNLRRTHISPSIEKILGWKPEQWEAADYYDNIHPEDREMVMDAHRKAFETNKFEAIARVSNRATKKYVWIHAIAVAEQNREGEITHINGLMVDVTEKQKALLEVVEKEKHLQVKAQELKQLNTTLNTLLEKRDKDRLELEQSLAYNIKEMILPYIDRIRNTGSAAKRIELLDVVENTLNDISSRFMQSLSTAQLGLTPTEIKVAAFVKQGKSTKEIAVLLSSSDKTVKNQRLTIRKKIGISNKKINLRTYLQSLQF